MVRHTCTAYRRPVIGFLAMHRAPLLQMLEDYLEVYPEDRVRVDHVRQFVRVHADCFERSCVEGHITGSAWILSADYRQVLLAHHRKLNRWLQPGGHADGDPDPERVARREAEEESGLTAFSSLPGHPGALLLDIDVHIIPARGTEPAHLHHDFRYLLIARSGQQLRLSEESTALRWFDRNSLTEATTEESLLRVESKTRTLLAAVTATI